MKRKKWLSAVLAASLTAQLFGASLFGAESAAAAAVPIHGAGLPEGWSAAKMYGSEANDPGASAVQFANRQFALSAEKGKVDSGGDNVVYAFMPVAGDKDFTFTARISGFERSSSQSWALMMLKDGTEYDSPMVSVGLDYNGGNVRVRDYRRLNGAGGGNTVLTAEEAANPVYVRMQREGATLRFTYSTDGGVTYKSRTNYNDNQNDHYTYLNKETLQLGFAVSTGSAVFDEVSFVVDGATVFDSNAVPVDDSPPESPSGLTAAGRSHAVELSWSPVPNAAYYQVKGGMQDGGPYDVWLDAVTGTAATIDGLENGVPYYFVVAAGNANGLSADSAQATAVPAGLTVPGLFEMAGFSAYNTGGGMLEPGDAGYFQVYDAAGLRAALAPNSGAKVIEIMNDLDLGWNEIPSEARAAPFAKHNDPLLHPVLLQTGVTKITVDNAHGLTIFSKNGSAIRHASLVFRFSSNIIIRNLTFDELWEWDEATLGDYDRNDWDYISLENGTRKVWIDHCTFGKAYDGVVDAKGGSSGITISWSTFLGDDASPGSWVSQQIEALDRLPAKYPKYSHLLQSGLTKEDIIAIAAGQKKGHLIGASEFASDNGDLELTLHHNYYKDMMDRIPRLRAGNAHVYNIVVDNSDSRAASKRITDEMAAAIAEAGFHFGVTSNGAISTEDGALLMENSVMTDVVFPLRNNQKDAALSAYTGKIKAMNVRYSLDELSYAGDSDTEGSPLAPVPAPAAAFSWNTPDGELPYLYAPDALDGLEDTLIAYAGAGKLYWDGANWLRTSGYIGEAPYGTEPNSAPTVVSGLQASPGDGAVSLRWGKVAAADSYTVYRSDAADGTYEAVAHNLAHNNYVDDGLPNGTTYYYRVSASNANGEGPPSPAVAAAPLALAAPAAPGGLTATSASTKIILDWNEAAHADYYIVQRRTAGTGEYTVIAPQVFSSGYEDFTAGADTKYEYAVIAVNGAGHSPATAPVRARLVDLIDVSELKPLLHDTFDNEATGSHPQHYTIAEDAGTVEIAEVPSAVNKSLKLFDDRTGVVQADRRFESQTKIAAVQFDFMHEAKANSIKVMRLASAAGEGATGNGYAAAAIETNGGHLAYRTNNGYTPFLMNYEAGVWYTITVVANLESGKADVYVDGDVALEQIGLFNAVDDISIVQSFTANNNSANAYYLDNIRVYGEPDGGTDPTDPPTPPGPGPIAPPVIPGSAGPSVTVNGDGEVIVSLVPAAIVDSSGRKRHIAEVNAATLSDAMNKLSDATPLLTLSLNDETAAGENDRMSDVEVRIPAAALQQAANVHEQLELRFEAPFGSYRFALAALNVTAWLAEHGLAESETATVAISMTKLTGDRAAAIVRDAEAAGLALLSPAVDFSVTLRHGAKEHPVSELNGYAIRTIALPASAAENATSSDSVEAKDSASANTAPASTSAATSSGTNKAGILYNPDTGTFTGVPTLITDGAASLRRTGNSIYALVAADRTFSDLNGHWAQADVERMASMLFVQGVGGGRFDPDSPITRAQFAALLTRVLGLAAASGPSFPDVSEGDWFTGEVAAAARHGLIAGYEDGTFRPHERITREQMAVMLARALKLAAKLGSTASPGGLPDESAAAVLDGFTDGASVRDWAVPSFAAAVDAGLIQGTPSGVLAPQRQATRAEAAVMLLRFLQHVKFI